jgi:DNA-binding transcriptional ArsR family regulator
MNACKEKRMTDLQLEETARLFGILSDASRLRILRELMQDAYTVSELIERTGLKQGNLSKHLGILYQAGFLTRENEGGFVRYSLIDPTVKDLCALMCGRIRERAKGFL